MVFTSDHGEMLGEHGMSSKMVFYEGSVQIPLLMRLPSAIPARTVVSAPVSHRDLYRDDPRLLRPVGPAVGRKQPSRPDRREGLRHRTASWSRNGTRPRCPASWSATAAGSFFSAARPRPVRSTRSTI